MDGNSDEEGRVEILYDGVWGPICDDYWGQEESDVMCRMLGFPGAIEHYCCAYHGRGSDPIWLDNVRCDGSENNIELCSHNGYGYHNCYHGEDVGVRCYPKGK